MPFNLGGGQVRLSARSSVLVALLASVLAVGCGASAQHPPRATANAAFEVESVRARFAGYTLEQARRDGYEPDAFCLDAASFGRPPDLGAMGFHATNTALLRGPIAMERPQALMFDGQGRQIGVEYEIAADAVAEPPRLFGQIFARLPAHPGVQHDHYALHVWFIPNPSGQFADFNPSLSCPAGSAPPADGRSPGDLRTPAPEHGEGH